MYWFGIFANADTHRNFIWSWKFSMGPSGGKKDFKKNSVVLLIVDVTYKEK